MALFKKGMAKFKWGKIKTILAYALENPYSSFYRDKYKPFGLDNIGAFEMGEDFFKIPFLTKEELLKVDPFDRLFTVVTKEIRALSTSGTTGLEPLIVFRGPIPKSPPVYLPSIYAKVHCELVLSRPQNIVSRKQSKLVRFFGNPYQMAETAAISSRLPIDSIWTSPELLINFLPFLERVYDLQKIKLLRFTGSKLTEDSKKVFRETFPNAFFIQEYSLTEFGGMAIQCEILARREDSIFHINSKKIFFEIIPTENDGEGGEIVLTNLRKEPSIFIRYKTGDMGELLSERCECGNKASLLRFLGRKNSDRIKLMGFEIQSTYFQNILNQFENIVDDGSEIHFYQQLKERKLSYYILVRVPLKVRAGVDDATKEIMENAFNEQLRFSNKYTFGELINQGLFSKIKVEFINQTGEFNQKDDLPIKIITHF